MNDGHESAPYNVWREYPTSEFKDRRDGRPEFGGDIVWGIRILGLGVALGRTQSGAWCVRSFVVVPHPETLGVTDDTTLEVAQAEALRFVARRARIISEKYAANAWELNRIAEGIDR